MFIGQYNHSIDAKGRLFIPVKYRDELGEAFLLNNDLMNDCISVYPAAAWESLAQALDTTAIFSDADVRRLFYSGAREASLDSQGRVVIAPEMRQKAFLTKDVVIVGVKDHFEIWDNEKLEEKTAQLTRDTIMARLKERGL